MIDHFEPPPPDRATVARRGAATLAGWYAAVIVAVAVLIGTLPDRNTDGTCEGIGFGCALTPRDGMLLLAIVYGIALLCAGVPASAVTLAIAVAARIRSGLVAGTLAAVTGFVAGAAAIPLLASIG
jgi:hypothetical protein